MVDKKNKNTMIICGAVAAVVVIGVIIAVVFALRNKGEKPDDQAGTEQIEEQVVETKSLSSPDIVVEYGDYDTMFTHSKAIQNGEVIGRIIKIDGVVSHPMSIFSIGEKDESGTFVGTEFVIEGIEEDDYPEDGARVILTGEIVEKAPLYYVIKTSPEYVRVYEEAEIDGDDLNETDDIDEGVDEGELDVDEIEVTD